MKNKIRVALLFGGKSAEHEVSLQSAKSIVDALDKEKYEIVLVGIDKQGKWLLPKQSDLLLNANDSKKLSSSTTDKDIMLLPSAVGNVDVVFPILHGTLGEDGAIQGLLKLMNVPFVGADVLGSAVGMDKDVMKRLLREAGIPIANFLTVQSIEEYSFKKAKKELGLPMFIKPANQGSSVGVHKVTNEKEYSDGVTDALQYDTHVLIEEFIDGKEIECSVLGNTDPKASVVGEIITHHEFYTYESKYTDAEVKIPADIPEALSKKVRETAIAAFKVLRCEGMARVDSFLTKDNKIILNEINTLPGFTKLSVYPKLWAASGLSYPELLDSLISLAIERHTKKMKIKSSYF